MCTKEVLVFVFDGYADWEIGYVLPELHARGAGYKVKTIAMDNQPKQSMGGLRVVPDYTLADSLPDFVLLILPGGTAWVEGKNEAVTPLVQLAIRKDIPVAAICAAVDYMAANGYLDKVLHTANYLEGLQANAPQYKGAPHYVEAQAVQDRNIVTANGSAALEFAREILRLMQAKPEGEIDKWYRLHKDHVYL